MALVNGHTETQSRPKSPLQHLGKRKRTSSLESDTSPSGENLFVKNGLADAIRLIKKHDPSGVLLTFPLPSRNEDDHIIKKQRTEASGDDNINIETRISSETYQTVGELLDDINEVKSLVLNQNSEIDSTWSQGFDMKSCIRAISEGLTTIQSQALNGQGSTTPRATNGTIDEDQSATTIPPTQILSLRSQTEHGIRQLFSGLPCGTTSAPIDTRRLPNGFELTEVVTVDKDDFQDRDTRRFGEVFSSHRNTKTLEMPRMGKSLRGTTVDFIAPFENLPSFGKNDFKLASLGTGLWIKYATSEKLVPNSKDRAKETAKLGALFKAAFSTFAPNTDNSNSIVTDFDRSRQWWNKFIKPTREVSRFGMSLAIGENDQLDRQTDVSDQDLEKMIDNFIPEHEDNTEIDFDNESILEEISGLIESLCSYQTLRHLQIAKGPSSASKPSEDEQGTYEMLRSQLQVLVSTLPPFAVAKLNGSQLDELNISTHLLTRTPDFVGTSQVDDYTLRRNRAAQAATSAAIRAGPAISTRPAYGTPASAYNAQARAYNNLSNQSYVARPPTAGMYNTPRPSGNAPPANYASSQYRASPAIHTPSVQQFQRPVVNGYGPATPQVPQSPYMQRPSQPGYQQRAQDSIAYNRMEASQKPIVNGDGLQYQQRQLPIPAQNATTNLQSVSSQQHANSELVKPSPISTISQPHGVNAEVITS